VSPMSRADDRYHHDVNYRRLVDMMAHMAEELELHPSELREAAVFACILVAERRSPSRIIMHPDGRIEMLEGREP